MKVFFVITFFLIIGQHTFCQSSCSGILIDFESESDFIKFDLESELWQIGKPNKTIFTESYSGERAIMTDTSNTYGNLCNSCFQINSLNNIIGNQTDFSFIHKFHTDTINDFGYVLFSLDGGNNWSLCQDTSFIYDSTCPNLEIWHSRMYLIFPYDYTTMVEPIFSGSETVWVRETYHFNWWMGVKKGSHMKDYDDPCSADSILFRFCFESDDLDNAKDGWIIDNIKVYWDFSGNVEDIGTNSINIYPNPCHDFINITTIGTNMNIDFIEIVDITGRILNSIDLCFHDKIVINTSLLTKGLYIVRFVSDNNEMVNKLIYKY